LLLVVALADGFDQPARFRVDGRTGRDRLRSYMEVELDRLGGLLHGLERAR